MKTYYKYWCCGITPVEVVFETANFVTIKDGRIEAKRCGWYGIFPTREEAKTYAITLAESAVKSAESRLEYVREQLEKAKAL